MTQLRHDWVLEEVLGLFDLPFMDLMYKAHTIHRENFEPNVVQASTLCSIKTGACPEDCKYCSQSRYYNTEVKKEPLIELEEVLKQAQKAKESGSTRFCMGAGWRRLRDTDLPKVVKMIEKVKEMGLETCMTLGSINASQAHSLKAAGLDYYNHNIDTSPEYYKEIITTRPFEERLETIENVRNAGINICSGGIIGMGETVEDRAKMLITLANLPIHPSSVPINRLVPIKGTPLENVEKIQELDFVRVIAVARILMPKSVVRLSAGRGQMSDTMQILSMFCGANSIFFGEELLTTPNLAESLDYTFFNKNKILLEKN